MEIGPMPFRRTAAIGREFSYELLAAVARRGEAELRTVLEQLTEAGLVFRRGVPPRAAVALNTAAAAKRTRN
jgi:hypothetical protein